MATKIKISQLPAKGANLEATDLLEVSEFNGTGYVTKSITGQEIIDSVSSGGVTDVTATAPLHSTGGTNPDISISKASNVDEGYLSSTDWNTFNAKQDALVSGTNIKTLNGASLLGSGGLSVQPTLVSGTNIKTIEGQSLLGSGNIDLTKSDVGLGNVDNTSDANKPVSTATQTALNTKQDTLVSATNIKTINGNSVLGSGDLVVSVTANPSVIISYATDGTVVTGTLTETISRSMLIPANTFTTDGMLEIVARVFKTGTLAGQSFRIYKNTSNTLTGATLIGLVLSASTQLYAQVIRTYRINSNTLTGFPTSTAASVDYAQNGNVELSTTFTTSVDNYILFAIQLVGTSDSSTIRMARATKYI